MNSLNMKYMSVFPSEDIKVGGEVKDQRKRLGTKLWQTVLLDINKHAPKPQKKEIVRPREFPGWIGNVMEGDTITKQRYIMELAKRGHILITGETGAGKDFLVRVIIEEILLNNEKGISR